MTGSALTRWTFWWVVLSWERRGSGGREGFSHSSVVESFGLREALETIVSERNVFSRAVARWALSNEVKIVRGESEGGKRSGVPAGTEHEGSVADYGKRWRL